MAGAPDAAEQIRLRGFVHIDGEKYPNPPAPEAFARFAATWDHLEPDVDLVDGGQYRLRRYGRVRATVLAQAQQRTIRFIPLGHAAFRQDTNPLYRGRDRVFAPMTDEALADPVLHQILSFDVAVAEALRPLADWEIGLHQVRIVARGGAIGRPTPEGRHRDGHLFVGMHMLARRHCVGGLSIIELSDGTTDKLTLTHELDTVIVDDAAVRHEVTPIRAAARAREGIRDMLLVDLNPYSG
jgi:hypothetical protein